MHLLTSKLTRDARRQLLLAGAYLATGCAQPSGTEQCPGTTTSRIYAGVAQPPAEFTLAPRQVPAIGALEDQRGELVCSSVLVDEGWALSARHCDFPGGLWYRAGGTTARTRIARRFAHLHRDLALLELEPHAELDPLLTEPFAVVAEREAPVIGEHVLLAGFGRTAEGTYGDLHFVAEPIVEVTGHEITVDGEGRSGACSRDSGGPLFGQGPEQPLTLIGVLLNGAPSCMGRDTYQRVDTVADWVSETIDSAEQDSCSGLTWEGTCEVGGAHWCDAGQVYGEACASGTVCGFDEAARGYRCVLPQEDPCRGAGPLGTCLGDRLVRCRHGELIELDCSDCGGRCQARLDGTARCEGGAPETTP